VNLNVANYLTEAGQAPDFVIADPPRSGLGAAVTRELVRLQAARLALVSCDPATLARDLAPLLAGGYQIDSLTLIDLFPQTFHIETVVRLSCPQTGPPSYY
jgi:23S rRNA (uracil1939-C5)-methyltransferase